VTEQRVDLGVIVRDSEASLRFYRDTLGLEQLDSIEFPHAVMHRLQWGSSLVKLTRPHKLPPDANPPGGMRGATGLRYCTLTVDDLDGVLARCEDAGYQIAMPRTEVRPGVVVAFVEDPDGNWVEFLEI
jgi:catechol 2,3-dioxygenase-like lactoylglutathione lyase family enzyme